MQQSPTLDVKEATSICKGIKAEHTFYPTSEAMFILVCLASLLEVHLAEFIKEEETSKKAEGLF